MDRAAVLEPHIIRFINEQLVAPDEPVTLDDNLLTGGQLDSVAIMRLIGHVEKAFGVTIPPPDLIPQNFRTVRIMAAYLAGIGARA